MKAPGRIITFYSYKGGTGRSMALANVAWILASRGKKVLVVDWDLEAPGLHRYFHPFLEDKNLTSSEGLVEFFMRFEEAAIVPVQGSEINRMKDTRDWYVPFADISKFAFPISWAFENRGILDFVPSGKQGPAYAARVNSFNWSRFYDQLGGGVFLEALKRKLREDYDYVLIDSRTGVSDTAGVCTVQMPDTLVLCFTYNVQSIEGAAAVAASVRTQRTATTTGVSTPIRIFPIPMRVERAEKERLDQVRNHARDIFASFINHLPESSGRCF